MGFPREPHEFINSNGLVVWDGVCRGNEESPMMANGGAGCGLREFRGVICRSNESLYWPQVDRSSSVALLLDGNGRER